MFFWNSIFLLSSPYAIEVSNFLTEGIGEIRIWEQQDYSDIITISIRRCLHLHFTKWIISLVWSICTHGIKLGYLQLYFRQLQNGMFLSCTRLKKHLFCTSLEEFSKFSVFFLTKWHAPITFFTVATIPNPRDYSKISVAKSPISFSLLQPLQTLCVFSKLALACVEIPNEFHRP